MDKRKEQEFDKLNELYTRELGKFYRYKIISKRWPHLSLEEIEKLEIKMMENGREILVHSGKYNLEVRNKYATYGASLESNIWDEKDFYWSCCPTIQQVHPSIKEYNYIFGKNGIVQTNEYIIEKTGPITSIDTQTKQLKIAGNWPTVSNPDPSSSCISPVIFKI